MDIDEKLREHARGYLLGMAAAATPDHVEAFVHSAPFRALIAVFHANLEKTMQDFPAPPPPAPEEPVLMKMHDLAAPAEESAEEPAEETTIAPEPVLPTLPPLLDVGFRLPNAKAGDAYRQPLEAVPASVDKIVYCDLATPSGLALTVDRDTGLIEGTLDAAGDFPLTVAYYFASEPPDLLRHATVHLTVNPDPKKMWKNLPPPAGAPYRKADVDAAALVDDTFRILAASKRGRSHAHSGTFRDDDFRIAQPGNGWQIVVLADGAGSARFSRQGAAMICEQASLRLAAALRAERGAVVDDAVAAYQRDRAGDEETAALALRTVLASVVGTAAYYAAKGIMDECAAVKETLQAVPKDYASTALVAICKRYPFGVFSAAYWVGDGAVGVYSEQDGITLLGDVDSGEFSGQTRFLDANEVTQEALLRRTRFAISEHMTALFLMTDGVSDPRFETDARLARPGDWHALWTELNATLHLDDVAPGKEQLLLDWLDFWSPGNHDDRTIALAVPLTPLTPLTPLIAADV